MVITTKAPKDGQQSPSKGKHKSPSPSSSHSPSSALIKAKAPIKYPLGTDPPYAILSGDLLKHCYTLQHFLTTIDGDKCSSEQLTTILGIYADTLFHGLHSFRPPSEASRNQIRSGRVKWHSKQIAIEKKEQDFVIKISDELNLDEIQSFDLLRSYLHITSPEESEEFAYDDFSLHAIKEQYYAERLCLLFSIFTLCRNMMATDHHYHKESEECMQALLAEGMDDELVHQFVVLAENPPDHMKNERGAIQMVEEMILLLSSLFLFFYNEYPCSVDKLLYLVQVFKEIGFGENILAADYSNDPGIAQSILQLKSMCVMVVLVALQLEDLQDEEKLAGHEFIIQKDRITTEMMKETGGRAWFTVDVHAPVLLGWSLWIVAGSKQRGDFDSSLFEKALRRGAIDFLRNMVNNGFDKNDAAVTGYKSVVKGLLSALLVLFPANAKLWSEVCVLDLYCETLEGEPALGSQFWGYDRKHPILRGWVHDAALKFPLFGAPLLRLMKALSPDADCANMAYSYIENLETCTVPISNTDFTEHKVALAKDQGDDVVYSLQSIDYGIVLVPAHTRGYLVADEVVMWEIPYDGWHGIIADLQALRKYAPLKDLLDTTLAALDLINTLMEMNGELAHRFWTAYNGALPQIMPLLLLDCLRFQQPSSLIAACLRCVDLFARNCSVAKTWRQVSPFLVPHVRDLLRNRETSEQTYPITLATLCFIDTVLQLSVNAALDAFTPGGPLQLAELQEALTFCSEVFTMFSTWPYENIQEKWSIGTRIMEIFHKVLVDYEPIAPPATTPPVSSTTSSSLVIPSQGSYLRNSAVYNFVLSNILVDRDTQTNLYAIIRVGIHAIELKAKERDLLETFVQLALMLADFALSAQPENQVTSLQKLAFEGETIAHIAEYTKYKHNSDIVVHSLRILTQLCTSEVSLNSYFADPTKLRTAWLASLHSPRNPAPIRFHLLAFFCAVVQHQPALTLLIAGKKPTANRSPGGQEDDKGSLAKTLAAIHNTEGHPQLLSETTHLIYLLWKSAANLEIVAELRANRQLWDSLMAIIMAPRAESPFHTSARAWALFTVALEMSTADFSAHHMFSSIANTKTQLHWIENYIPESLSKEIEEYKPEEGFSAIPKITSSFHLDKIYGDRYVYDTALMERRGASEHSIARIKATNICLSVASAMEVFLQSWCAFLYTSLKFKVHWFNNDNLSSVCVNLSHKLRTVLQNDSEYIVIFNRVSSLFLLVCRLLPRGIKMEYSDLAQIFTEVASILSCHTAITNGVTSLDELCSALLLLLRNVRITVEQSTTVTGSPWQLPPLAQATEVLINACWGLLENESSILHDSAFCLLGALLNATKSPALILNCARQPSLLGLLSVFAKTLQKEDHFKHAENTISFILLLASHHSTASALLTDGLMNIFSNKNIPFFSRFSYPSYTPSNARNPWHRVWCTCVTTVVQLLATLKFTEDAVVRAMEFVNTHTERLWDALNLQSKELKFGTLEEVEKITQLLKEISVYTDKWRFAPSGFVNKWGNEVVRLLHFLVQIFSSEVGVKPRLIDTQDTKENQPGAKEGLLLGNIVNCLFILQISGPQIPSIFIASSPFPRFFENAIEMFSVAQNPALLAATIDSTAPIFAPTYDFTPTSPPNLAVSGHKKLARYLLKQIRY